MSTRALLVPCLAAFLVVAGCRQADGPQPAADGDVPNRLDDIGKDLQSIASGDAQAPRDLADDLGVFIGDKPQAKAATDELSQGVARAISGRPLAEEPAKQISRRLWTTVAARELSEKQVETLLNDLQATLISAGVADPNARAIAAQASEVQKQVTDRGRRWYEVF